MARNKRNPKGNYGIAEWYGHNYKNLTNDERRELLKPATKPQCPFLLDTPELAPKNGAKTECTKKGGVCSIRNYIDDGADGVRFGPITVTCPNRFLQDRVMMDAIGSIFLNTEHPRIAKEIPFLKRVSEMPDGDEEADAADVGRIDMVCAHPDPDRTEWCAVELQAVYFSGGAMSNDFKIVATHTGNDIPMPGAGRRPDFRSSGPKRLMPQLQIKVPTLRRWGKKMVVVVDEPFFGAMGKMDVVSHQSNCDIGWMVLRIQEDAGLGDRTRMELAAVHLTTLEESVIGLTAGVATTLPEFEDKLSAKLPPTP